MMIVGVDLDNTLICYDGLFQRAGVAGGILPPECPASKQGVRTWLMERDRERDFTILQGEVYGAAIQHAPPYPGALECLRALRKRRVSVYIVSHKTKYPVLGTQYDLHNSARAWLSDNGFAGGDALSEKEVFLEPTLEDKARRVAALGCTHFIDDMRSFLAHPLFPLETVGILFSPHGEKSIDQKEHPVLPAWVDIENFLLHEC